MTTRSPVEKSKPDKVISVSPHEPSTSLVIVASNESPTTKEELIIADAITNPAISRAACRLRRRIFSFANRHIISR